MRPGDSVIATAFGNERIERISAQSIESTIGICTKEEWDLALSENRAPRGVGFPFYAVRPPFVRKSSKRIKAP